MLGHIFRNSLCTLMSESVKKQRKERDAMCVWLLCTCPGVADGLLSGVEVVEIVKAELQ